MTAYRAEPAAIVLAVRVTTKAARDDIAGVARLSDGSAVVRAQVRAPPHDGAANAALTALIAKRLGVAKSLVTVAAGRRSRLKHVRVAGDPDALARVVSEWPSVD